MRAYTTAILEYERGRLFTERDAIDGELQAVKERSSGLDIDGSSAARIAVSLGATNKFQLNRLIAEQSRKVNARLVAQVEANPRQLEIWEPKMNNC